jgi:GNAT superfamily N-acetyltransferase
MKLWAVESGTLWLSEAAQGAPPEMASRLPTAFAEVSPDDWRALQAAMSLPDPALIRHRFQTGRRCFGLRAHDQLVAYGWATRGPERVGELERVFRLNDDEVYIWDCGTVPTWRGQRCYTALLSHMLRQFHDEGIARRWIGASRQNQPSIRGIVRAGFQHVMDVVYRRLWRLTVLRFVEAPAAGRPQLDAAYRILTTPRERRWGRTAVGLYRGET